MLDKTLIKAMTDTLKHRGPDDEGFLAVNTDQNVIYELAGPDSTVSSQRIESLDQPVKLLLGHRRLSILDLSPSGHQPMANPLRSTWVVYNGEIYNYIELRAELERFGYCFQTNTDTEVLLSAYDCWGVDCLKRFNGMWAFVIFDRKKNVLFGSRDRFGVKPLYYFNNGECFAFASEIKALRILPFVPADVNEKAVFDYLVFNWVEHEEDGFFKEIRELPISSAFSYDLNTGNLRIWKYYHLPYNEAYEDVSSEKQKIFAEKVRELLFQAVSLRLRSDVPIGSCLSGGLDSSTVVCILNELLKKTLLTQVGAKQRVFTALFPNQSFDETEWAKEVVEKTSTVWYRVFPKSQELVRDMEHLVYIQDIPFGSTSVYAQYRVMKLAKESGVKVLLDGQGGDELFGGYPFYYPALYLEMIKQLAFIPLVRETRHLNVAPVTYNTLFLYLLKWCGVMLVPNSILKKILHSPIELITYLNSDFWNQYRWRVGLLKERAFTSLNRMLYEHMTGLNLKTLLRYEDRNSMAFSIEARTPMADDLQLIEYLFQIPSAYKIYQGWSKHLLREAVGGIVPEKIRWRRDKIGFATPENEWLEEVGNALLEYFNLDIGDFINVKKTRSHWSRLIREPKDGQRAGLWRFINLAVWMRVIRA